MKKEKTRQEQGIPSSPSSSSVISFATACSGEDSSRIRSKTRVRIQFRLQLFSCMAILILKLISLHTTATTVLAASFISSTSTSTSTRRNYNNHHNHRYPFLSMNTMRGISTVTNMNTNNKITALNSSENGNIDTGIDIDSAATTDAVDTVDTIVKEEEIEAVTKLVKEENDDDDDDDDDDGNKKNLYYQNHPYFPEYEKAMNDVLSKFRIKEKKAKEHDFNFVSAYLLSPIRFINKKDMIDQDLHPDTTTCTKEQFIQSIENRKNEFYIQSTNKDNDNNSDSDSDSDAISSSDNGNRHEMIARALTYIGDHCAKHKIYEPLFIAWEKMIECGIKPRINSCSSYLYMLSASTSTTDGIGSKQKRDDSENDVVSMENAIELVNEVAYYHDMLYSPTENTVSIRIKSLVQLGKAQEAEELLFSLLPEPLPTPPVSVEVEGVQVSPSSSETTIESTLKETKKSKREAKAKAAAANNDLRLRTSFPILQYYCTDNTNTNTNTQMDNETIDKNASSALKLYHKMKNIKSIHLDKETNTMLLSSLARNGYFCHDEHSQPKPIEGAVELGYSPGYGPLLFDQLIDGMSSGNDAMLELCDDCVNQIRNAFVIGFQNYGSSNDGTSVGSNTSANTGSDDSKNDGNNDITTASATTTTTTTTTTDMVRNLHYVPYDCHLSSIQTKAEDDELVVNRVTIDETTNLCPRTDAKLRLIMLDELQRKHMHDTLLTMADVQYEAYDVKLQAKQKKSKKKKKYIQVEENYAGKHLDSFATWLDTREGKPFTVIVDGANVAYFGLGSINYQQVKIMVSALEAMGERPLVVMPQKYAQKKFYLRQGYVQELTQPQLDILDDLKADNKLYQVPYRCLDDYYWMLSSVSNQTVSRNGIDLNIYPNQEGRWPGTRPILISNDQMRDHKLALLEPRLFRRWFSSHIVNYEISPFLNDILQEDREIKFVKADSFSREIQGNPSPSFDGNCGDAIAWHFPVKGWDNHDRFCVRIPKI